MFQFCADLALARHLNRRTDKRQATIIRRKSDGSLWAASAPQNFAYAMRGLFSKGWPKDNFHFAKVRIWLGLPIVSPKLFWLPHGGEFEVLQKQDAFWLAPWSETTECEKIDRALGQAAAA